MISSITIYLLGDEKMRGILASLSFRTDSALRDDRN